MADPIRLEFKQIPSMGPIFARGVTSRKRPSGDVVVPRIEADIIGVRVSSLRVAAYRRVCEFRPSEMLPVTYPQIVAAPLHGAMMSHTAFPFPLLGLVHVRSTIRSISPIAEVEPMSFRCWVEGSRDVKAGREFDLFTEVVAGGRRAWESTTTVLARGAAKKEGGKREDRRPEEVGEPAGALQSVLWRIPPNAGRKYARVSGDYNPIHLFGITAKAFGFPRAIAHGMWTLARSLSAIQDRVPAPKEIDVSFRRPVLLPSTVLYTAHKAEQGHSFAVRSKDGTSVHLVGSVA